MLPCWFTWLQVVRSFQPGLSLIFLVYLGKAVDSKSFVSEKLDMWYPENVTSAESASAGETEFKRWKWLYLNDQVFVNT